MKKWLMVIVYLMFPVLFFIEMSLSFVDATITAYQFGVVCMLLLIYALILIVMKEAEKK